MSKIYMKTFVVEDSEVILKNLVSTLEELTPVKVVGSAPDAASAIDWLAQPTNMFDLLIIDIFLKSSSGLTVLSSIMELSIQAKRVVLTNYATREMRARCAALGAHRVFDKSSEIDELIENCVQLQQEKSLSAEDTRH